MTIAFISGENRNITVEVNGNKVQTVSVNSGGWGTVGKKVVNIELNPGRNSVRLYNTSNWMPDIDYMELRLTQLPDAIGNIQADSQKKGKTYDLSGRPTDNPTGIFIQDGHKYLKK